MAKTAEKTHPELWEKVKKEITESSKGGKTGEWSARKAQLAVQEYKKRGGDYRSEQSKDNSLKQWTEEEWGTKSGRQSRKTGERYLPKKVRKALSDEEYRRTSEKKRRHLRKGEQFSKQPKKIAEKTALYRAGGQSLADRNDVAKEELMMRAREMDIPGRSRMNKETLCRAVHRATN